jgi:hypothetical protein
VTELAVVPDSNPIAALRGVVSTSRVGVELAEDIRFNDWRDVLDAAIAFGDASVWVIADCVAFGMRKLKSDPSWMIYATMIEERYRSRQSLYDLGYVARSVEISRRREILSFSHHREVASLPPDEQRAWLDDAISHNWSTRELREEIQRFRDRDKSPAPAFSLRLVDEHFRIATSAAERRGMDPKTWVLEAIREKALRESPGLEVA